MSKTVQDIAYDIVRREGGYVNDPDDPGGATNHGVTIHTMRRLGLDLDLDGDVDAADVQALQPDQAVALYLEHYYVAPRIGLLPEILRASVFDMYVNAGVTAVKLLQQLLRQMGYDLAVDGVIGPVTSRAAREAAVKAPQHLADAYGIARRNYYFRLADRRVASRKFARSRSGKKGGWIRRAEEFIRPEFHLTEAEFLERTEKWG